MFLYSLSPLSISGAFCFTSRIQKKQLNNDDDDGGEESSSRSLDACFPTHNVRPIRASDVMRAIRSVHAHTEEARGWL